MAGELHFYDAANPENIPAGVACAVYINGEFVWPANRVRYCSRVFSVSVEPEAYWAEKARCLDIESGAAAVADLVPFIRQRRHLGFDDATGYVNRSNWQACREACAAAGIDEPYWWVSTLDGTVDVPGAWAVQYQGGMHAPYDVSVLLGVDNLHKP